MSLVSNLCGVAVHVNNSCQNVAVENTGEAWHRRQAKRIGEAVAERRKQLGMTGQQLAARCADLGVPIHRTTITKIEKGRPRFDLGELIVLAAALETSPVCLIYPDLDGDWVEVLPSGETSSFNAVQWFSAFEMLNTDVYNVGGYEVDLAAIRRWDAATNDLRMSRLLAEFEYERSWVATREPLTDDDRAQMAFFDRQIRNLSDELRKRERRSTDG